MNDDQLPDNIFGSKMILQKTSWFRRLLKTDKGYLGIASAYAELGDCVCILYGSSVPMVLRYESERWTIVAECYVHGIMDGEGA